MKIDQRGREAAEALESAARTVTAPDWDEVAGKHRRARIGGALLTAASVAAVAVAAVVLLVPGPAEDLDPANTSTTIPETVTTLDTTPTTTLPSTVTTVPSSTTEAPVVANPAAITAADWVVNGGNGLRTDTGVLLWETEWLPGSMSMARDGSGGVVFGDGRGIWWLNVAVAPEPQLVSDQIDYVREVVVDDGAPVAVLGFGELRYLRLETGDFIDPVAGSRLSTNAAGAEVVTAANGVSAWITQPTAETTPEGFVDRVIEPAHLVVADDGGTRLDMRIGGPAEAFARIHDFDGRRVIVSRFPQEPAAGPETVMIIDLGCPECFRWFVHGPDAVSFVAPDGTDTLDSAGEPAVDICSGWDAAWDGSFVPGSPVSAVAAATHRSLDRAIASCDFSALVRLVDGSTVIGIGGFAAERYQPATWEQSAPNLLADVADVLRMPFEAVERSGETVYVWPSYWALPWEQRSEADRAELERIYGDSVPPVVVEIASDGALRAIRQAPVGGDTDSPTSAAGWQRIAVPGLPDADLALNAFAVGSESRLVLVGDETAYQQNGRVRAWWWDGAEWRAATFPGDGSVRDVIEYDSFYAVGQANGLPAVWTSTTGETWELSTRSLEPGDTGNGIINAITGARNGLYAAGFELYAGGIDDAEDWDAAVWFSGEADTWIRISSPAFGTRGHQPNTDGEFNARINGIADASWGLVAAGSASESGAGVDYPDENAAVWVSPDGQDWRLIRLDPGVELVGVTASGDVAVAYGWELGVEDADGVLYWSSDGESWTRVDGPFDGTGGPDGVQRISAVEWIPGYGWIAVGADEKAYTMIGAAAVWRSVDLLDPSRWVRVEHNDAAFGRLFQDGLSLMTDVHRVGDTILVIGYDTAVEQFADGSTACCRPQPTMWRWTE